MSLHDYNHRFGGVLALAITAATGCTDQAAATDRTEADAATEDASVAPDAGADADAGAGEPFPLGFFFIEDGATALLHAVMSDAPEEPKLIATADVLLQQTGVIAKDGHWYRMDRTTEDPLDFKQISSEAGIALHALCSAPDLVRAMDGVRGGFLIYGLWDDQGRSCQRYVTSLDASAEQAPLPIPLNPETSAFLTDHDGTVWGVASAQQDGVVFDSLRGEEGFVLERDDIWKLRTVSHGVMAMLTLDGRVELFCLSERRSVRASDIEPVTALDEAGLIDREHVMIAAEGLVHTVDLRTGESRELAPYAAQLLGAMATWSVEHRNRFWSGDPSGWNSPHLALVSGISGVVDVVDVDMQSGEWSQLWSSTEDPSGAMQSSRILGKPIWADDRSVFLTVQVDTGNEFEARAVALDGSGLSTWSGPWVGPVEELEVGSESIDTVAIHGLVWERDTGRILLLRNGDPNDEVQLGTLPPGVIRVEMGGTRGHYVTLTVVYWSGEGPQDDVFLVDLDEPDSLRRVTDTPDVSETAVGGFY